MDRTCPHCHRAKLPLLSVMMSRSGGQELGIICPHCSAMFSLERTTGNWINLISFSSFAIYIVVFITIAAKLSNNLGILFAFGGVVVMFGVRALATEKLGKLVGYEYKHDKENGRKKINFGDIKKELEWLVKGGFFLVLFDDKDEAYISVYFRKGKFVIELAFATEALKDYSAKFRSAVSALGLKIRQVNTKHMRSLQVDVGNDIEPVTGKVSKIMCNVFNMTLDKKFHVMRNE